MAEPASTSAASAALAGASLLALFPGLDAGAVLGAFAGAAVFVMSSNELSNPKKFGFLCLAIVAGLIAAPMAAALLATVLPDRVQVSAGVGALIASALVIKILIWLINKADNPADLLSGLKGGGK
ncbi:putative phage holin [Crenobacter luteus]|uniref:putative holin n=1 Tax=Crenobacter luteus TaxID=1452487 RepID=UPI00104DDB2B|nr:putative holin [Crenobacter luteus]TCP13763.1 putative phage holin [Crenobacter luteus]